MATQASVVDVLLSLDSRLEEAASDGDFDALEPILAEDFIYTHSSGKSQGKSEWLEGLKPLAGKRQRVLSGVKIEPHGGVAVVMGDMDIVRPGSPTQLNRYVRVYRLDGGRWRAISQRTVHAEDRQPA